jgi:HEAT repeat protein
MPEIPALIRLLEDPDDEETLKRAFGEPERLDIDEDRLPHEDDQPFLFREVVCNDLADLGPDAIDAVPALVRCTEDATDSTVARFMRLAAVTAIWKITDDPTIYISICERLLGDSECWFRRHVVELLEEIAHPAAVPTLRERLGDVRFEVQEEARKAIQKIEGGTTRE